MMKHHLAGNNMEEVDGGSSHSESQSSTAHDKSIGKGKRKANEMENFFAPRTKHGSQPSLRNVSTSKEVVYSADLALAKWFFDSCLPINALNSPFAQEAIDAIAAVGPGYQLPSYYQMRVNLLRDCKKECKLLVESSRLFWKVTGCTLMVDRWTDSKSRTLINFFVYCPRGLSFIKSVDVSDIEKDAITLYFLFTEVVEWIGPKNVVQLVTESVVQLFTYNVANYKKAGELLHEKYGNIYWSPCAAHCLNLILKDIGSMPHVINLAKSASKVTIFIYNHIFVLSWLRKRAGWREIVRPEATRFATTFITLKSIFEHKLDLQAFITSKCYAESKLAKTRKGKEASSIISDSKFWNYCMIMSKLTGPLIRLLRVIDSDEKPSLGYVYDGMYKVRKALKAKFKNVKMLYKPYTCIIKRRWDGQLRQGIHAAAYFLNPQFQYDQDNYCHKPEVLKGLLELVGNKDLCPKPQSVMKEIRIFTDSLESFGKPIAKNLLKEMQPDEWWKMFGFSAPNLQKLAIRVLSQTSSSSGCEKNWSVFEQIHAKKRNHIEHQRLNDLVYVRYNLNLRNRLHLKRRSYDPLDYTSIEAVDFWIVDEHTPELDYEDLEREIYQEDAIPITDETNMTYNRQTHNANKSADFEVNGEILGHEDLEAFEERDFGGTIFEKSAFEDLPSEDEF